MLSKTKPSLNIVIPVYNEEECLSALITRLLDLKKKMTSILTNFIFINDGSRDRTLEILYGYAETYSFVKVISLSRNFGHQIALTAGLDQSNSDYVAIIDADLQDPPEIIEKMYLKSQEGFDIVYGMRIARKGETFIKKATAALFYRLINRICDVNIPRDTGDFRFINKKILDALKSMPERHRFIRGMVPWVGFKSTALMYQRDERYAGDTKYPFKKMVKFANDAVFSFSNIPLKIANFFGMLIVGFGFLASLLLIYLKFFTKYSVPGITAVIITVIIIGGIQIIMIGIVGEYIGRIFEESKHRPLYIVENTKNI